MTEPIKTQQQTMQQIAPDDLDFDITADILLNFVRTLALFTPEQLEVHLAKARASLSNADSLGPILDPTAYRNAAQDGTLESAKIQLQITEHIIRIRRLMVKLEALSVAYKAKTTEAKSD